MEYWVLIHGHSPAGAYLLSMLRKIGGATATQECDGITHPLIVAIDLDWSISGFLRMTHLQDPGEANPLPRELFVPAATVQLVVPHVKPANQPNEEQQKPPFSLH